MIKFTGFEELEMHKYEKGSQLGTGAYGVSIMSAGGTCKS